NQERENLASWINQWIDLIAGYFRKRVDEIGMLNLRNRNRQSIVIQLQWCNLVIESQMSRNRVCSFLPFCETLLNHSNAKIFFQECGQRARGNKSQFDKMKTQTSA